MAWAWRSALQAHPSRGTLGPLPSQGEITGPRAAGKLALSHGAPLTHDPRDGVHQPPATHHPWTMTSFKEANISLLITRPLPTCGRATCPGLRILQIVVNEINMKQSRASTFPCPQLTEVWAGSLTLSEGGTSSKEASGLTPGHRERFCLPHTQHQLLQEPRPCAQGGPES